MMIVVVVQDVETVDGFVVVGVDEVVGPFDTERKAKEWIDMAKEMTSEDTTCYYVLTMLTPEW